MADKELLELAAKAAGYEWREDIAEYGDRYGLIGLWIDDVSTNWNPLEDDGDRYRLARTLGIHIDFAGCSAWAFLNNGEIAYAAWNIEDCPDEAHCILIVAAAIGEEIQDEQY